MWEGTCPAAAPLGVAVLQQMGQPVVLCRVDGIDQRLGGLLHLGDGPALFVLPGLDRGAGLYLGFHILADGTDGLFGYLLWGGVGTGKSYFAGCVANALMEQEVAVRMTNFALILNDLTASFEGRNEYITRLCRAPLLILDDFGMERGTEYSLEQVYNVIDSRYRSRRPLIVTTNLSLQDLQHPQDTAHARIYDRLLEMCAPIRFSGENFRRATAQDKLARLKNLMD